jgi:phospholipase A1
VRLLAAGYTHHSNGQSLPASRSWDRVYLMTAAESPSGWSAVTRVWQRVDVGPDDDNPGIEDFIGRAEIRLLHDRGGPDAWALTLRHAMVSGGRGSARLDWFRAIGEGRAGAPSNLRLQVGVFSGYGDSIIDYNFKRTVLTLGLSLLDF